MQKRSIVFLDFSCDTVTGTSLRALSSIGIPCFGVSDKAMDTLKPE